MNNKLTTTDSVLRELDKLADDAWERIATTYHWDDGWRDAAAFLRARVQSAFELGKSAGESEFRGMLQEIVTAADIETCEDGSQWPTFGDEELGHLILKAHTLLEDTE